MLRKYTLFFAMAFCLSMPANAAFPIQAEPTLNHISKPGSNVTATTTGYITTIKQNTGTKRHTSPKEKTGKSHATAILLNLFFGVFGLHRFYLGYTLEGFLQLLGYLLIVIGTPLLTFIPVGFTPIAAATIAGVCIAAGVTVFAWEIIDFFRICNESLTPKKGSYR